MLLRRLTILLLLLAFGLAAAPPCRAADPENPFKKSAVGDWASYKSSQKSGGTSNEVVVKMTVSAKDHKEVTLKVTITIKDPVKDQVIAGQDLKIDLTKPFDPTSFHSLPLANGPPEVKLGDEAKETIAIGKTRYECKVINKALTFTAPKKNAVTTYEFKIWTSDDAPFGGLVKMEVKYTDTKDVTILEESGTAK
jgi:hypothetical protein